MALKRLKQIAVFLLVLAAVTALLSIPVLAAIDPAEPIGEAEVGGGAGSVDPNINISINGEGSDAVRFILLMTVLSLLPSIIIMMTCFTRMVIVFSLLRNALGLQQTPPNQVLIGLAIFLTMFVMMPVISEINETAFQPYSDGEIGSAEFLEQASGPLKTWMLRNTKNDDLNMFLNLAGQSRPETLDELGMQVVIPAFITSELKWAFTAGFLLFIPFLIIDMVVASALMSMGMMMLPPVTISLPFKIMLFVLVDGWGLVIRALVTTYN